MKNVDRSPDIAFRREGESLIVLAPSGQEYQLTGEAAAVFLACDGTRDVAGLQSVLQDTLAPEATREDVFAILDALADLGVVDGRVTPPGSGHRTRRSIVKMLGAAAAFAVTLPLSQRADAAPGGVQGPAAHAEQQQKGAKEQANKNQYGPAHSEPNRKRAAEEDEKRAAEADEKRAAEAEKKNAVEEKEKKESEERQKKDSEERQKKDAEEVRKREAEERHKNDAEQELKS